MKEFSILHKMNHELKGRKFPHQFFGSDLFQEFQVFINLKSHHAQKAYGTDLPLFFDFFQTSFYDKKNKMGSEHFWSQPESRKEFLTDLAQDYYQYLDQKARIQRKGKKEGGPLSAFTKNRRLASISSFFSHLIDNYCLVRGEKIEVNPFIHLKKFQVSKELVTPSPSSEEVQRMFDTIDLERESGPLWLAVLHLVFSVGLRNESIRKLKRNDFYQEGEIFRLNYSYRENQKKWGRPISIEAGMALLNYIETLELRGVQFSPDSPLLRPSRNRVTGVMERAISHHSLIEIVKQSARRAGISTPISPHSGRLFVAHQLEKRGLDIDEIGHVLDHMDKKTTKRYGGVPSEEEREEENFEVNQKTSPMEERVHFEEVHSLKAQPPSPDPVPPIKRSHFVGRPIIPQKKITPQSITEGQFYRLKRTKGGRKFDERDTYELITKQSSFYCFRGTSGSFLKLFWGEFEIFELEEKE